MVHSIYMYIFLCFLLQKYEGVNAPMMRRAVGWKEREKKLERKRKEQ